MNLTPAATLTTSAALAYLILWYNQRRRLPFQYTALKPFGVLVHGASAETLLRSGAALRKLWHAHGGLLVVRDLSLTPKLMHDLSTLFGDVEQALDDTKTAFRVGGLSSVMRIGNVRDSTTGELISMHTVSAPLPPDGSPQYRREERQPVWHTDSVYRKNPPIGSALYCHVAPPSGAATCFTDTASAFAALDDQTKARLRTLEVVCSLTHHDAKVKLRSRDYPTPTAAQRRANPPQRAPLVLTHPRTGVEALYGMNSGTFAVLPKGSALSAEELDTAELEAREMPSVETELRSLLPHATQPKFVVAWQWREGDLVIWDNRCTMHAATGYHHERHTREMWRTTIVTDRV